MAQVPNLLQGPEPVETADLHFKHICKLKLFESNSKYEEGNCSLLAVSQHFGLVFAGNLNGFTVLNTKLISSSLNFNEFPREDVVLKLKPSHIAVDFSQKYLAVVCSSKPGSILILYSIATFSSKGTSPLKITPISKIIQNPASEVVELSWQPNTDNTLMLCMSDGSVLALNQINKDSIFSLPNTTQATCFCWSPKGKQIVIGSAHGTLSQYKPDLKLVKNLPPPPLFNGAATVVTVLWISSYQFVVAYNDRNNPESFPVITVVNAAKNEPVSFINYDDITYSSTLFRSHQLYLYHQSSWNLIFVSSANSMEVAVLHSKDNSSWEQWLLGDSSRAELPLNADRQETFPLGLALDFTNQESIPWGEGTLPPMPRLLILSDEGVLCIFNVVNAIPNAPQLCNPPAETLNNLNFIIKPTVCETTAQLQSPKSLPSQPTLTFGTPKPSYSFGSNAGFGAFTAQPPPNTTLQATASIQGNTILGNAKDASLTLQQQQKMPQLQLLQQSTIPQIQPQQNQGIQKQQPLQQQPVNVSIQTPSSTTPFKFSSLPQPQFVTSTSSFSFCPPKTPLSGKPLTATPNTTSLFSATSVLPPQSGSQVLFQLKPSTTQTDLFAKNDLIQSTPKKQSEPEKTPTAANKKSVEVEAVKKPEEVALGKENNSNNSPDPANLNEPVVDDSVYWNALHEEIKHFNTDLQQLSARVGSLNVQIGTEDDKLKMKKSIDGLYNFWKELKETTVSQSSEIHSVVMDLMESFAWLEDAKSRNLQRKNPSFVELKKSEELDPLSARHMSDISHLKYYIENQLKQLTTYLEKEWMDHQENCRLEVKNRMTVPPLEEVYKTMHYHLKILSKQRNLIEDLKEKLSVKKRKNKSQSTFINHSAPLVTNQSTKRVSELSKLAEDLLQLKINRDDYHPNFENWEMMRSQIKSISNRWKKLTSDKQAALRDVLSERDMVIIRPVKTTFESSSFLRNLPLEKPTTKSLPKAEVKRKEEHPMSPLKNANSPKSQLQTKFTPKAEIKEASEAKVVEKKTETPKSVFVFGVTPQPEKSLTPLAVQPRASETSNKSPLASLSGIVSSIGKENEINSAPPNTFAFGTSAYQNPKDTLPLFGNPKQKEPQTSLTFGISKPVEPTFGKLEPPKFGNKLTFSFSTPVSTTIKPAISGAINPVTASSTASTTVTSPFTFSFGATTTSSPTFFKTNMFGKDQSAGFGTKPATGNAFSVSSVSSTVTTTPASAAVTTASTTAILAATSTLTVTSTALLTSNLSTPLFGTSTPIFGGAKVLETSNTSPSSSNKAETLVQPTGFTFNLSLDTKKPPSNEATQALVALSKKSTPEKEEIDVVNVEEPALKPDSVFEASAKTAETPKFDFGTKAELTKSILEITTSGSLIPKTTQTVSVTSTTTTLATTSTTINKLVVTTSSEVSAATTASATHPATTAPVFSFSTSSISFGQTSTTTVVTTCASIFGQTPTTTASTFGQVSSTSTTSIFGGNSNTVGSSAANIFGNSSPATPIFGQASMSSTSTGNIFGGSTSATHAFGQLPTSTTTPSAFGTPSTPTTSPSAFGQPSTQTTSPSAFGQPSTQTTSPSAFGQPSTQTTSPSAFGQPSAQTTSGFGQLSPQSTSPSAFGQPTTQTTSPSTFGQKPDSVAQTTNIFGQLLSDSNRAGGFGASATTPTTTSNIFSKNIFGGASTTSQATTASLFGKSSSPIFPQTTSVFGQPTTTSSVFGQTSTSTSNSFFNQNICSPFGGGTSTTSTFETGGFNSKPVFGQSLFGQATGNTSIFGGSPNTSIFGGSSTSPNASKNVFQTPTTNTSFGSTSPGPFSSGGGSVAESGFRAASTFQKTVGGFGSPPVFGGAPSSTPAFGASPAFSGSPSFGSLPTFGSRPGAFDTSQGGFSQPTGHSTTFENLANQNTVGFGNLAQQSQNQGFGGGGFGSSSFENKPAFGGNSFSSWRSK